MRGSGVCVGTYDSTAVWRVDILSESVEAIRIFSVCVVFFACILTFVTYYTYCGYIGWAAYFYGMHYLVIQNIALIAGGICFGMTGMWWGLSLSSMFS